MNRPRIQVFLFSFFFFETQLAGQKVVTRTHREEGAISAEARARQLNLGSVRPPEGGEPTGGQSMGGGLPGDEAARPKALPPTTGNGPSARYAGRTRSNRCAAAKALG
ncbi:hypothetical protein HPB52_022288 [Rhipicephalus sanguineus]|uniref:Secreted protein n=1 Tax=Rhipicephalus sanguineus TaxID=34632 RepID=A0A9D4YQW1_RHISA|nr:hypothetical protein HPB52_022288 [Rhipicephalus sanguineus]